MIKNQTILEVIKENRSYQLQCEPTSPLGELHDVLSEMKYFIVKMITDAQEKEKSEPIESDNVSKM